MRELAKSFFGFSLAMSLFGLEQLGNLLSEKRSGNRQDRIKGDLDDVREAMGRRFSGRVQNIYESGDRLQREMVDLTFDIFKADNWKPERVVDLAADLAEKSAEALRDAAGTGGKEDDGQEDGGRKDDGSQQAPPSGTKDT